MSIDLLLFVLAFLCFAAKAIGVPSGRVDLMNAGFALLVLTLIV